MISLRDSLTLAHTKIRSKRVRLLITTIVSALVFGVIAGATVLLDGISTSLTAFARENLRGQYLVQGQQNYDGSGMGMTAPNDPTMIAEVTALHTTYIAERKAAAKRLGITDYDERTEIPPVVDDPNPGVPAEFRRQVNMSSVAYARWQKAQNAAHPPKPIDLAAFRAVVERYRPTKVYEPLNLGHLNLQLLIDGKEDLTKPPTTSSPDAVPDAIHQTAIMSGSYTVVDDHLVANYLRPPNAARKATTGVPVLINAEDAVALFGKALGLPKRPSAPKEQIAWFTTVRDKVNGATYVSCHRNSAEQQRVETARVQANEMESNKNNRDYVKPSLQWAMPTTPCGMVTVAKDTRTAVEKYAEASRAAFEREFAIQPVETPLAEAVTFQVVGLLPSRSPNLSGVDQVLADVLGTNFGYGAVIPEQSWRALPAESRHEALLTKTAPKDPSGQSFMGETSFIAAFPSVDRARAAVRANSCTTNWTPQCQEMPFSLSTFGSNYLAVDDITTQLRPVILVLLGITFGIATIIIWAMMGRVISDSRRETAVFRAIGAKRSDIVAVYLTYSLWVAARIVLLAGLIGALIAGVIHLLYAERATTLARLSYGVFAPEPTFSFLGFSNPVLWQILGGIVLMALVAITPPLLRNIRRNPIKDMRDE